MKVLHIDLLYSCLKGYPRIDVLNTRYIYIYILHILLLSARKNTTPSSNDSLEKLESIYRMNI